MLPLCFVAAHAAYWYSLLSVSLAYSLKLLAEYGVCAVDAGAAVLPGSGKGREKKALRSEKGEPKRQTAVRLTLISSHPSSAVSMQWPWRTARSWLPGPSPPHKCPSVRPHSKLSMLSSQPPATVLIEALSEPRAAVQLQ